MTSFRRIAITAMLTVAPVLAVGTAWANTELVPASRLVAPYWDISGDRSTLMFITNVSRRANLVKTADVGQLSGNCNLLTPAAPTGVAGTNCAVHLEFYDKTCDNRDLTIDLTKTDLDQLDLNVDTDLGAVRALISDLGWLDVDVRRAITGSGHTNTGVQANVLVGTVVITDSGSDFAVAYPMASSIGSSGAGVGGDIVTRDNQGDAVTWTGSYESFPARVYVPMFFAEGTNYSETFESTLAIAGPAQSYFGGEAPGQDLEDDPATQGIDEGILIDVEADVVDACENVQSDDVRDHYVFGSLNGIFAAATAPYLTSCGYPSRDVDRVPATTTATAFQGGYVDLTNNALGQLCENDGSGNGICVSGITGLDERGLVGVLVQNTTHTGDATRLWGDCSFPDGTQTGSQNPGAGGCRTSFSLADQVSHSDLRP